jgi:hypothetical protein
MGERTHLRQHAGAVFDATRQHRTHTTLFVLFLLLLARPVVADDFTYTKFPGNPLRWDAQNRFPQYHYSGGEMCMFLQNDTITFYIHEQDQNNGDHILSGNSTDPVNLSVSREVTELGSVTMIYCAKPTDGNQTINGE